MEISEGRLRRYVREADEAHRVGMATITDDIARLHADRAGPFAAMSRRRVVGGVGIGGITITLGSTLLPWHELVGPGWADQAQDDRALAKFAQSLELAAVAGYQAAATSGKITTPAVVTAAQTFAGHHQDHAKAFGALAGDQATT